MTVAQINVVGSISGTGHAEVDRLWASHALSQELPASMTHTSGVQFASKIVCVDHHDTDLVVNICQYAVLRTPEAY